MPFQRSASGAADYASPEELYRDLPRRKGAVPGLWSHQADILRTYVAHANEPDVALELPTGTGKTLTGLLIAEWTRRTKRARVAYACPTQQLAKQVAAAAYREGVGAVLLVGKHDYWDQAELDAYESASAIAITTYSSIINSRPYLPPTDLLLFDDAHAGEQYVGEQYAVDIKRRLFPDAYETVLAAVTAGLDGVFVERLREDRPDPSVNAIVRMVVPLRQPGMVHALDAALASLDKPHKFQFSMIRAGLASCLVYVSYSEILVRPYLPPTYQNQLFTDARQRLYLSATLGEGGELERAFGRAGITRLALPAGAAAPRYGRRFFVFPDFVEDSDPTELAKVIVGEAGKALVLAPQTEAAMKAAAALAQPGWPVLGADDVADGMQPFADLLHGTCGLAARYDGLDLPGDSCRVVALDGLPDQDSLQERFLTSRARAGAALAARVRTRIVQGAGRCTRGPGDTAIVVVLNPGLSRYLGRPEVISALDSELQAEIRFGRENSQDAGFADVLSNVRAFLNQETDESWRDEAEPALTDYRREMPTVMPTGTDALAAGVADEIAAWASATVGRWGDAAIHAHEVARLVGTGGSSTKGYRAFWLYLEAVWTDQAAETAGDPAGKASAQALIRQAENVMGLGSWVRELAPLPSSPASTLSPADANAVTTIVESLEGGLNQGTVHRRLGEMHAGLGERDPKKYEPALTELGRLVGATSSKPPGSGRCDSIWCWGNELWLALEAKSDHEPSGVVPHKEIRQANDQLRLLASDRGVPTPPTGSATVLISPKPAVHDDGVKGAEPHVFFVAPALVNEIAFDVDSVWQVLLGKKTGRTNAELRTLVADTLSSRGVLPSQLLERLTREPVSGLLRSAV